MRVLFEKIILVGRKKWRPHKWKTVIPVEDKNVGNQTLAKQAAQNAFEIMKLKTSRCVFGLASELFASRLFSTLLFVWCWRQKTFLLRFSDNSTGV